MKAIAIVPGTPGSHFADRPEPSITAEDEVTGVPGGDRPLQIPGAELIRRLVLSNQVMVGSVNAAGGHFQMAVDDLSHAHLRWGAHIAALITNHYPSG